MNFKSDNVVPASPEILKALMQANHGTEVSYGEDSYSIALQKKLSEIFEKDVQIYLTNTGTAANSLALSALVQPYQTIYCHEESHLNTDESGAPVFFTGGSQFSLCGGANGKLDVNHLNELITTAQSIRPHAQKPGCISVTQATECGTVYSLAELKAIHEVVKNAGIPMHMDGARFTNALVTLGCTPAELTWKAGVDVMSFGATKNGALCAEAVIFFNPKYAEDFDYRHKRAGQLMSKSRFFACQLLAYLDQDLWLKNARHANTMAQKLAGVFGSYGIEIVYPIESNELFVTLSANTAQKLEQFGCGFYEWGSPNSGLYRFVTSFYTKEADINGLEECMSMIIKG
jgi:threonine aldolase